MGTHICGMTTVSIPSWWRAFLLSYVQGYFRSLRRYVRISLSIWYLLPFLRPTTPWQTGLHSTEKRKQNRESYMNRIHKQTNSKNARPQKISPRWLGTITEIEPCDIIVIEPKRRLYNIRRAYSQKVIAITEGAVSVSVCETRPLTHRRGTKRWSRICVLYSSCVSEVCIANDWRLVHVGNI